MYLSIYSYRADCIAIHCTTHPSIPLRLVATCSDATIRLISPVGGAIITTALLPSTTTITNTAYKPHHGNPLLH